MYLARLMEANTRSRTDTRIIIILKIFIKRKIFSVATILSAYAHTRTHTRTHTHTHTHAHTQAAAHTSIVTV